MKETIIRHFEIGIQNLIKELNAFPDEASIWQVLPGVSNSPGNLCYHLWGNLNHFVGHHLGNTGYVRNRPLEFSIKDVPRAELIQKMEESAAMLRTVISAIPDLDAAYPDNDFGKTGPIDFQLIRLYGHLVYHLGQINYLRRIAAADGN